MKKFGKLWLVIVFLAVILLSSLFVKRVEGFASAPSTATKVGVGNQFKCAEDEVTIKYGNKDLPVVYCLDKGDYKNTSLFFPSTDPKFGTPICEFYIPSFRALTGWKGTDFSSDQSIPYTTNTALRDKLAICKDNLKSIRVEKRPLKSGEQCYGTFCGQCDSRRYRNVNGVYVCV